MVKSSRAYFEQCLVLSVHRMIFSTCVSGGNHGSGQSCGGWSVGAAISSEVLIVGAHCSFHPSCGRLVVEVGKPNILYFLVKVDVRYFSVMAGKDAA